MSEKEYEQAKNYAFRVLEKGLKSKRELEDKLKKREYSDEIIGKTLERMKELGFIDDDYYAKRRVEKRSQGSKWGKMRIKQELYHKGIEKDVIDEAVESIDQENELENAIALAEKKMKSLSKYDEMTKKKKLFQFLQYRGYGYDICKRVLDRMKIKEDFYE